MGSDSREPAIVLRRVIFNRFAQLISKPFTPVSMWTLVILKFWFLALSWPKFNSQEGLHASSNQLIYAIVALPALLHQSDQPLSVAEVAFHGKPGRRRLHSSQSQLNRQPSSEYRQHFEIGHGKGQGVLKPEFKFALVDSQ